MFLLAAVAIAVRLTGLAHAGELARAARPDAPTAPAEPARAERRGEIRDRTGQLLATSIRVPSVYVDPSEVVDPEGTARRLTELFPELSYGEVLRRLQRGGRFAWIKRFVSAREQQAVHDAGLAGIGFRPEWRRVYPAGPATAHLIGWTDPDGAGLAGLERAFDGRLGVEGQPLTLALDLRMQHAVRDELARAMAEFRAIGAVGIVQDVATGEVLAAVSLPDFDPADPAASPPEARFNRLTLGQYEMGSTFKILTLAMALEAGVARPQDLVDASRPLRVGRFTISDYHPEGRVLSVREVLVHSSNIGTAQLALAVGVPGQQAFLEGLGLFGPPTLELPELGRPLVPRPWTPLHAMTISFGHGMAIAPVQLTTAVAAVIGDGYAPATLVLGPRAGTGERRRIVSPPVRDEMRRLMRAVVTGGTGRRADVAGYRVGGKTGTAEKPGAGGYRHDARISSFVGAFPMDQPRFVVLAMLDEPQGTPATFGYATGGWTAAPTVGRIVARIAPLAGMRPEPGPDPAVLAPPDDTSRGRRLEVTLPNARAR